MRIGTILAGIAVIAAPIAVVAKQTISPSITKALADPARAADQGDDGRRQTAAVLAFSGVKPGQQVIDFLPGKGYWSRIFTGIVGPSGHVYAVAPAPAAGAPSPAPLPGNVTAVPITLSGGSIDFPASVDLFWTVENYHDIANRGRGEAGLARFNSAVFKSLKRGGTYVVIDHAAPAGSGLSDTDTLHRIDPAIVKTQVLAAGFVWVGESKALSNPKDDHTLKVFDPAIRGHTDQFVYKFRKP